MEDRAHRHADVIQDLIVRVTILETSNSDLVQSRKDHNVLIDKLIDQDNKAIIALNNINSKFDALIKQFALGFRIVMVCGGFVTTSVTGFWIYNKSLDDRYTSKMDAIAVNTAIQRELIAKTSEDLNKIKQLKSVAGSK